MSIRPQASIRSFICSKRAQPHQNNTTDMTGSPSVSGVLCFITLLFQIALQSLLVSCSPSPEQLAAQLTNEATRFHNDGMYNEAILRWQKILKLPPKHHSEQLYIDLANTYQKLCQVSKATLALQHAAKLYPDSSTIQLAIAKQETLTFNLNKAAEILASLGTKHSSTISLAYGDLYVAQKKFSLAEKSYRAALQDSSAAQKDTLLCRLAICLLGLGKTEEAEQTLGQLSQSALQKTDILLQKSLFYRIQGNLALAQNTLQSAIAIDPKNLLLKKNLAELFFVNNNYRAALPIVEDAILQSPPNRFFMKFAIELHLRLEQMTEAEKLFEVLENGGVIDVETYLLKGKYYLLGNEPDFAVSMFSEAVKKEPKFPLSHYLLAVAYLAGNHRSLARQNATKALSLDPNFTQAELLLADIFFLDRDFATSLEYLDRLKQKEPENYRSYLLSGQIYFSQNAEQKAQESFNKAERLNNQTLSPAYYAIQILEKNDPVQAAEKYRNLLGRNQKNSILLGKYLTTLDRIGGTKEVARYANSLTNQPEVSVTTYLELGKFFFLKNDFPLSEKFLQRTLDIDKNNYAAYFYLARLYESKKQWHMALAHFQQALQHQPRFEPALLKLAEIQQEQISVDSAITTLQDGLSKSPDSAQIANNLACLYLENNINTDDAFILAQKAYDRSSNDPAIADTLGWAYFKKQNLTRAKWLLEEALAKKPNNPTILFHLAKTYQAGKDRDAAQKFARQAIANGLKSGKLAEAQLIIGRTNN